LPAQQDLMAALQLTWPMRAGRGVAGQHGAAFGCTRRVFHLDEVDSDLAVHAECELVMAAGEPGRNALRAHHFLDIFHVLGDDDAFIGLRLGGNFEHVREHVVPGGTRHQLDAAFRVVRNGSEDGVHLAHRYPPPFVFVCLSACTGMIAATASSGQVREVPAKNYFSDARAWAA
jgi:hypothetical protein